MSLPASERQALLTALAAYVLPEVDGIGGLQAGVPEYLEQCLTSKHGASQVALIDWGLNVIQSEYQARHDQLFAEGEHDQCVQFLTDMEALEHRDYQMFWRSFIRLCMEGFLSHPRHGGNRDAVGWKAIGYPGYSDYVRAGAVRQSTTASPASSD